MNTFQLSCFLAVAEYLNFAQAAQSLHVTHPTVSHQIRSLEKELNIKLFQRTTRTVKLTEGGKIFLNDAQQIVAISERAKRLFASEMSSNIETFVLGCSDSPCLFLLADTLQMLRTLRPKLHPQLQVISFQHIYRMLEDEDLDAIVGFKESAHLRIHALYKEITKVPMMCICSMEHPLSSQEELSLKDLKEEQLVLFVPPKGTIPIAQMQVQLMENRPLSDFYFCESIEAISSLVMAGYGISVLPDCMIPVSPRIAKIPLKDAEPMSFGIYYKTFQENPMLKAFIQCAKECFSKSFE